MAAYDILIAYSIYKLTGFIDTLMYVSDALSIL